MIKHQQSIIKKGDYYEYEASQQLIPTQSKTKRQEALIVSSTNLPVSQYISSDILSFKDARSQYYFNVLPTQYKQKSLHQLKSQLYEMLNMNEQTLKDEDRKQIEKLIEQIDMFKDSKQLPLLNLTSVEQTQSEEAKKFTSSNLTVNLTTKHNLKEIQAKIARLQGLDFPQLHSLQHKLQVMIGDKKPITNLQPLPKDYPKQEINNLYNHLNSMQILKSLNLTIEKISLNEQKHVEMKNWIQKNQKITALNQDLLAQLKEDQQIINKLENNFKTNIQQVRSILKELK